MAASGELRVRLRGGSHDRRHNREIAVRLVITERTAAAHIEHILDKLSFSSRTQIGVWAAHHYPIESSPV